MLRRALRGPCRVAPGSCLLVAVSGGADSTALLLGLHRLAKEFGYTLLAAHLNHGLRGEAADKDQRHVEQLCRGLGVPLVAARWDTRARMRRRGLSGQGGLRRLRREFLRNVMIRHGCVGVATGHHADDQLETVLARLLRGTSLAGLGGMSPRRGVWRKPLLGASRHDLEADLERAGVAWREDASNRDPRYLRSRLRGQAIPALLQAGGAETQALARSALAKRLAQSLSEVREARRLVDALAAELLRRAEEGGTLDLGVFAPAPRVVRAAALRLLWRRLRPGQGLTASHREALLRLAAGSARAAEISLPGAWQARRRGNRLGFRGPTRWRTGS